LLAAAPLAILPVFTWLVTAPLPHWQRMWLFALSIYAGCKWLTWRLADRGRFGWRDAAYLFAWPGMDARAFLTRSPAQPPSLGYWLFAAAKVLAGVTALICAALLVDETSWFYAGWLGMLAVGLILHFGLFDLLSLYWRSRGAEARPLMNWPVLAESINQYWGCRWNTAFRDLAHQFVFRPVAARFGARWALGLVFLASGVVHDLVISLPAGAGYGGPTLFFAIQAGGALVEHSPSGRRLGLGHGLAGWLFTMLLILAPLPLLFHRPFVTQVVLPMLRDLQGLIS
jgi:alginate O-acetyltransferase complex protein AlgI